MISVKDKEFLKRLGMRIREIRKSKGLSMENLAHKANLEYSQISRIELGANNATICSLKVIADALEVSLSDMTEGVE